MHTCGIFCTGRAASAWSVSLILHCVQARIGGPFTQCTAAPLGFHIGVLQQPTSHVSGSAKRCSRCVPRKFDYKALELTMRMRLPRTDTVTPATASAVLAGADPLFGRPCSLYSSDHCHWHATWSSGGTVKRGVKTGVKRGVKRGIKRGGCSAPPPAAAAPFAIPAACTPHITSMGTAPPPATATATSPPVVAASAASTPCFWSRCSSPTIMGRRSSS